MLLDLLARILLLVPCSLLILAPAVSAACCSNESSSSVIFEGLMWKSCADNLLIGTETTFSENTSGTPVKVQSKLKSPRFDWSTGCRLGVGYKTSANCCWGVFLHWTHFHNHAKRHYSKNLPFNQGTFTPGWGAAIYGPFENAIDHADAQYKLHTDWLDASFGADFYVCHNYLIRPHIGLRAAWFEEKYQMLHFELGDLLQDVSLKSRQEGIGPRIGLEVELPLQWGFCLLGSLAGSYLYDDVKLKSQVVNRPVIDTSFDFLGNQTHHTKACKFMVDSAIGLKWSSCICNESLAFSIQIGWESHLILNKNHFEDLNDLDLPPVIEITPYAGDVKNPSLSRDDLAFRGWTLSLKLDF